MKASELISLLSQQIYKHGDLPVLVPEQYGHGRVPPSKVSARSHAGLDVDHPATKDRAAHFVVVGDI